MSSIKRIEITPRQFGQSVKGINIDIDRAPFRAPPLCPYSLTITADVADGQDTSR